MKKTLVKPIREPVFSVETGPDNLIRSKSYVKVGGNWCVIRTVDDTILVRSVTRRQFGHMTPVFCSGAEDELFRIGIVSFIKKNLDYS